MKQLVVFLSGVAAMVTGVFIRSCGNGAEMDLAGAWCGKAPTGAALLGAHPHCAGCAMAFAGLIAMGLATASLVIKRNLQRAGAEVRQ